MNEPVIRCFLGLGVGQADIPAVQAYLAPLQHDSRLAPRWVDSRNWHLTLVFLGDQTPAWLEGLQDECRQALSSLDINQTLMLRGKQISGFPDAKGRIVALLLSSEPTLPVLKTAVDGVLTQRGYATDARRFRPHITLGRFGKGPVSRITPIPCSIALTFSCLTLYQSVLTPEGPYYHSLWSIPLRPASSTT